MLRGTIARRAAGLDAVEPLAEEAIALSDACGDPVLRADARTGWARALLGTARQEQAIALATEAARIARTAGAQAPEIRALFTLGTVRSMRGESEDARRILESALVQARRRGDAETEVAALVNLAITYKELGLEGVHVATLEEAMRRATDNGFRRFEAGVALNLGVAHQEAGRLREAERQYREALRSAIEVGELDFVGMLLGNLGDVARELGRLDESESMLRESLDVTRSVDNRRHEAGNLFELAATLRLLGRPTEADEAALAGLAALPDPSPPRFLVHGLTERALAAMARGDVAAARALAADAMRIAEPLGESRWAARARIAEAEILAALGEDSGDAALIAYERARSCGDPLLSGRAAALLAAIAAKTGRADEASAQRAEAERAIAETGAGEASELGRAVAGLGR